MQLYPQYEQELRCRHLHRGRLRGLALHRVQKDKVLTASRQTTKIPYHTIPYHTIPYHAIPYHTIPYHAIPYHTIPYHTISDHTPLYYTLSSTILFGGVPVQTGGQENPTGPRSAEGPWEAESSASVAACRPVLSSADRALLKGNHRGSFGNSGAPLKGVYKVPLKGFGLI